MANRSPTPCTDLISLPPNYIGYCDASKASAGRVWFGRNHPLPPIVWQIHFPKDIQQQLVLQHNPTGIITNQWLDSSCTGLSLRVLQTSNMPMSLQVATIHPQLHGHHASWHQKAHIATHLICALALCMLACQASPLAAFHIVGKENLVADLASCSHAPHPDNTNFLTQFSLLFPTPQGIYWIFSNLWQNLLHTANHHIANGVVASNNQQWHVIGATCSTFSHPTLSCTFKTYIAKNSFPLFKPSSNGSAKATLDKATKSELAWSRMPLEPLARPLNWMGTQTPYTSPGTTSYHIHIKWQIEAFKQDDLLPQPQLTIPIDIPNWIFQNSQSPPQPQVQAIGELCLIAVGIHEVHSGNKWMGSSVFDALNKTTSQTAGLGLKTKMRQQDQTADQHKETSEH